MIPGHADMASSVGVFATILVAVQAPELLGRDVRYRVLSLYFSRALLREDYALAKLAALSAAVLILLLVPHVILTVGAVLLTSDVLGALGREAGRLAGDPRLRRRRRPSQRPAWRSWSRPSSRAAPMRR